MNISFKYKMLKIYPATAEHTPHQNMFLLIFQIYDE